MLNYVIIGLVVVFVAVFLVSDSDIFLNLAPYNEVNAFNGKVVWVVGASSGIGANLAIDLAKSGAKLAISARRTDMLSAVASNCTAYGSTPKVVKLDLLDSASHQVAYDEVIKEFGHIDYVVLNAGRTQRSLALYTPIDVTKDVFALNFFSFVELTRIVLPEMIKSNKGQVSSSSLLISCIHP